MCLGHTHALSGLAAGAATATLYLHAPLPEAAMLTGLTAAFAMAPDMDQRCSSAGRSLGFLSAGACWLIGEVSGGHRHLSHSAAGVAAFTALAWAAGHWRGTWEGRAGLALLLAVTLAAALGALGAKGHLGDATAIAGALGVTWYLPALALVPLACALGCASHLLGDSLTDEGIPLLLPLSKTHFRLLPEPLAFTTGTRPERWVVAPGLIVALGWIAWHAVSVPGWL